MSLQGCPVLCYGAPVLLLQARPSTCSCQAGLPGGDGRPGGSLRSLFYPRSVERGLGWSGMHHHWSSPLRVSPNQDLVPGPGYSRHTSLRAGARWFGTPVGPRAWVGHHILGPLFTLFWPESESFLMVSGTRRGVKMALACLNMGQDTCSGTPSGVGSLLKKVVFTDYGPIGDPFLWGIPDCINLYLGTFYFIYI